MRITQHISFGGWVYGGLGGGTGVVFQLFHLGGIRGIHSKSWIRWIQKSADDFEFSAKRLSENAKSIKITLFAELLTVISPIYVQSLQ